LWSYTEKTCRKGKKRSRSPSDDPGEKSGNYKAHSTKRMRVVDNIHVFEEQRDKHRGKQLRAWSHLLEMGKHDSYEEPPDKPFFRGRKRSTASSSEAQGEEPMPVRMSPGKYL